MVSDSARQSRRSISQGIFAYIELIHPGPVLIVLLGTAALSFAIDSTASTGIRTAMLVSMLGAQIVIGVVNELADRDIDRLTRPEKPLTSGRATVRGALVLLNSGIFLLVVGSLFLDWTSFLLTVLGCGVGVSYSLWFKRTVFAWAPYVIALPLLPIWISVAVDHYRPELLSAYPFGFCAIVGVQLAQSVTDVDADREVDIRSVTTVLGEQRSMWVCWAAIAISALLVAIIGRDEPAVLVAVLVVLLGISGNAMLYRDRPKTGLQLVFPTAALGAALLGVAWVYAIGT